MKKRLLRMTSGVALLSLLLVPVSVRAAEINPPASSYSTGSTSELSPYSSVTNTPDPDAGNSGSSLINTGTFVIGIAAVALLLIVTSLIVTRSKNVKYKA